MTDAWVFAVTALMCFVIFEGVFRFNWWLIGLCCIVAVGSSYSRFEWQMGAYWIVCALFLFSVLAEYRANAWFWSGVFVVGLAQAIVAGIGLEIDPGFRASGFSLNASMFGIGNSLMLGSPAGLVGAVNVGMSGSRTALIACLMFVFTGWRIRTVLFATVAVFCFVIVVFNQDSARLGFPQRDIQHRIETVTGDTQSGNILPESHVLERIENQVSESRERNYWLGYGYRGYVWETAKQRPHNVFIASFVELGVLSFAYWYVVVILIGSWLQGWQWLKIAPLLVVGVVTDELYSRPESLFAIGLFYLANMSLLRVANHREYGKLELTARRSPITSGTGWTYDNRKQDGQGTGGI